MRAKEGPRPTPGTQLSGPILVAIQLDDRLAEILKAAEALALMSGAPLRLVHVCDPWTKSFLATAVEQGPMDLVEALKLEAVRSAARRLERISASLSSELKEVETEVLEGDVTRSLAQDAESSGARFILIGARRGGGAQTTLGFSTAVSLIMEARVPVFVLNEAASLPYRSKGLRVVVADDFSEVASGALDLAFALALSVREAELTHLHVESFGETGPRARSGARNGRPLTPDDIVRAGESAEAQLAERAGSRRRELLSKGGRYHAEAVCGRVADEIERTACASRADVVIFGQHRVFHRETVHVGQVPFKTMLSQPRCVAVVPCH